MPTKATLDKYGITEDEYWFIFEYYKGICPICGKVPKNGKLVIDHYHVPGFKKLKPEEKRKHIRGLLCTYCNYRMLPRGMTAEKAYNIRHYLAVHPYQHWRKIFETYTK